MACSEVCPRSAYLAVIDHRSSTGQNRPGDHYLFAEGQGALREALSFQGDIHGDHHTGMDQLLVDALLDRDEAQYHLNRGEATENDAGDGADLHEDILGDGDGLFVEERPGSDSASVIYTPGDVSASHAQHSKDDDQSFDDADFEIAVDQQGLQEQDLHGDFLPESVDGEVEIATEHLRLAEDVAFFTTRTVMDNSHERLIDDETLNRLKEEMKRMDQEKAQLMNGSQHSNDQSTPNSPLQTDLPVESSGINQQIRYTTTYQVAQPDLGTVRANILPTASLIGGTPTGLSVNDSDASPQSEASGPPQPKQPRRQLTGERRDSVGSSGSRGHNLIPLCEETGKRMMMKDRMDQLAVSQPSSIRLCRC